MSASRLVPSIVLPGLLLLLAACGPDRDAATDRADRATEVPATAPVTDSDSGPTPDRTPPPAPAATQVEPGSTDRISIGRQIVGQAFSVLSSNLLSALTKGSPSDALEFCSINVGPITSNLARAGGVDLRRVTHKARNPANRATGVELGLIESYRAGFAAGRTNPPVLITNATGSVSFYAPILLGHPACLLCHGEPGREIAPDTLAAVDRLYPADEARGFRPNELRGLWVVTFPKP